jgi:hypothetical protein
MRAKKTRQMKKLKNNLDLLKLKAKQLQREILNLDKKKKKTDA